MKLNKGAMFGLDARIALAIFGALSVISGAALYSAIKSARTEQWRQYFEELTKASEQYYLDNGKQLPVQSLANDYLQGSDLIQNRESLTTWNGPYFQASIVSSASFRAPIKNSIDSAGWSNVWLRQSSTWTEMNDNTTDEKCVTGSPDCSEWLTFSVSSASFSNDLLNLFNDLDALVDDSDGPLSGKVRYNTESHDYIMYKGLQHTK